MNINDYQAMAMTTLNPELSRKEVLINSVMGLCGESGEAIDIVKKWLAQAMRWTRNIWQRSWATLPGIWQKRPPRWKSRWRTFCRPIWTS